jgi:hypothetical protein
MRFKSVVKAMLKNPKNASTKFGVNREFPMILGARPFVERDSKDERRHFSRINAPARPLTQSLEFRLAIAPTLKRSSW